MKKNEYETLDCVSRMFEMSPVWLHQLRIKGNVRTKCVYAMNCKQRILYNVEDIEQWIESHLEDYQERAALGYYNRMS